MFFPLRAGAGLSALLARPVSLLSTPVAEALSCSPSADEGLGHRRASGTASVSPPGRARRTTVTHLQTLALSRCAAFLKRPFHIFDN